MLKSDLQKKVTETINDTRIALQTVYDSMNHGQQKQIVREEAVKVLFDRYGVAYTE